MKDILPVEVLERPKKGFAPPLMEWHNAVFEKYGDYLDQGYLVESNILTSKFYRFNTLLINNKNANEKLLLNAFNIISNPSKKHNTPVLLKNDNIEISLSELEDNPNTFIPLKLDEIYFKTKIVQRHYNGFESTIGDIKGFLPFQNITDINLKQNNQENLEDFFE